MKKLIPTISLCLLITACQSPKQEKVVVQLENKNIQYKKEKTIEIDGKEVKIEKHGDHYHVHHDGRDLVLNKKQLQELQNTKTLKRSTSSKIRNVYQHGDHYHVELEDGTTYITDKKPTENTFKNPITNNQTIVKVEKHGDHYHVELKNGIRYITYEKPKNGVLPEKKVEEKKLTSALFEKVVRHGDHYHVFYKGKEYVINETLYKAFTKNNQFDEEKALGKTGETIANTQDETIQAYLTYIAKVYNVKVENIRYTDEYFVFNDPNHEYDPTHIHPYFIPRASFYIPETTGQPELDFENELIALSKRTNIPVEKIVVENNRFVLQHSDHAHYLNILSNGYEAYTKNKLPHIQGEYIAGAFHLEIVKNKVAEIQKAVNEKFSDPVLNRRRTRELEYFLNNLNVVSNSTEGYLKMLEQFNDVYVLEKTTNQTQTETTVLYNELLVIAQQKNEHFYRSIDVTQEKWVNQLNENSKDLRQLEKLQHIFKEYEKYSGRRNLVGASYVNFFQQHLENTQISHATREKIATILIAANQSFFKFKPNHITPFIELKFEILQELAQNHSFDLSESGPQYQDFKANHEKTFNDFLGYIIDIVEPVTLP